MKKFIIGLLAVLAVGYMGGIYYFTQYALPNTTLNGVDRSYQKISELFSFQKAEEPVEVTGRGDRKLVIAPESIGLKKRPVSAAGVNQNAALWPVAFAKAHSYEVSYEYSFDEAALAEVLQASELMQAQTESSDATIVQTDEGIVLQPEEIGTEIRQEALYDAVVSSLHAAEPVVTVPDTAYVQPKVRADDPDLAKELKFLTSLYETRIVYDFEDRTYEYTGMTLVDLYDQAEDGTYAINYDRTRAMLADMATETDTFGQDREFTTTYGTTVTIPGGPSIYGWLMDVDSTTEEFIGWVEERHSEVTTPFYYHKAMNRETDEIGNTYIEIDLDSQWMYVYLDGELIDQGPTVSGQPSFGTPTPVAVNYIIDKMKDRVLRGIEPETGEPYETPVDYWFSINWSDVGIHNSTWRTEFGGDIYLWLGSYGCVNVVDHLAETIYYNIPVGTPVISY